MARRVKCQFCGQKLTVPRETEGRVMTCPHCKQSTVLSGNARGAEGEEGLQLRKTGYSLVDTGKPCPSCGVLMGSDAVVCTNCGFNVKTRRKLKQKKTSTSRPGLALAVLLLLVLGGAWAAWRYVQSTRSGPVEEAVPAPVVPLEGGPPETALEPAQVWARLRSALDQKYPLFEAGETVALRTQAGLVVRGVYQGFVQDQVVFEKEDGSRERLPMASLDKWTRVRCDAAYREQVLEQGLAEELRRR